MRILHRLLIGGAMGALAALWLSSPAVAQERVGGRVRCESLHGKFNRCRVPWRDAELLRQESKGACIRGQSWGLDREGLWVDRGCRGQFAETFREGRLGWDDRDDRYGHGNDRDRGGGHDRRGRDDGWQPGADWNRQIRLQCDSHRSRYQMCQVDVGRRGHVELVRQLSGARCTERYSWGWNRAGVWVDHGCRGRFVVDRRW